MLRHAVDHMNGFPFSTFVTIAYQSCLIVCVFGVRSDGIAWLEKEALDLHLKFTIPICRTLLRGLESGVDKKVGAFTFCCCICM